MASESGGFGFCEGSGSRNFQGWWQGCGGRSLRARGGRRGGLCAGRGGGNKGRKGAGRWSQKQQQEARRDLGHMGGRRLVIVVMLSYSILTFLFLFRILGSSLVMDMLICVPCRRFVFCGAYNSVILIVVMVWCW